jgi:hypothetical protein
MPSFKKKSTAYKKYAPQSNKQADTSQAKAIVQLQKKVKKLVSMPELKQRIMTSSGSMSSIPNTGISVGNLWQGFELSINSQSSHDDAHVADKITPKKLVVKYCIETSTDDYNRVRVVIMQIKGAWSDWNYPPQVNTTALTGGAILGIFGKNAMANTYKVLYDKTHVVDSTSQGASNIFTKTVYPKHTITYPLGGSTTAQDGAIMLMVVSDSSASPNPIFLYNAQLSYYDI